MYRLCTVKPDLYQSIKEYRRQFLDNGDSMDGCSSLERYDDIEKWDLNCQLFEDEKTLPPGYSLSFQYVYLDDDEVVGMTSIRPMALEHPYLKTFGGHIGYSVKPSRRRSGIATMMLKDTLDICKNRFGLNKVLVTCLKENIGSRKAIINNGGVFEKEVLYPPKDKYLERYWISI
ncbi:MAG: GNAT family N-acetyltransferase [Erysipelotrichaceae bacterium]|nr:GNAT family N-acetyltransferase [Erysipelotrichaceae bacterium]